MGLSTKYLTDQDREKIRLAVQLHTPVEIISYTLPREKEFYIHEVLTVFLEECHQEHMTDNLIFCLGELLTNSKKANTKRVYFKENNLDINNEMDYQQGMISFKEDTLNNINHYLEQQEAQGLYVKLILQLYDEGLKIEIRNNSVLTVFETKRINEKLKAAKKYTDPAQVITRVIDQTEGAGLGIIIIVLMLRKIGLSHENYKVFSTDTETITQMILPLNKEMNCMMDLLYDEFVGGLNTIPVFEDTIQTCEELIQNPETTDEAIIEFAGNDVSLTSVLLKESAARGSSCSKISCAYKQLGRETVSKLLSKDNPGIRLINKELDVRHFWRHEYEVAFYAYNLALNCKKLNNNQSLDEEEVYVCGLMHDIECLLLEVATDEQKKAVKKIADRIENGEKLYQFFLKDFGHSRGCYKLAQKWGLPERVAQVVRYHNAPSMAPEDVKELVYIVYLADIIQYYKKQQVEFYQIDENVREFFKIKDKQVLDYIISLVDSKIPPIFA